MTAAPNDKREVLGKIKKQCSRSLALSKFSDPGAKDEKNNTPRRNYFTDALEIAPATQGVEGWQAWISSMFSQDNLLFGRLLGRMALHLSGSSMENAGILLDRYGLPYIPGSGIKGCARRTLIAALREWVVEEKGAKAPGSPLASLYSSYDTPAGLLSDILLLLGWVGEDFKKDSDLVFACGEEWPVTKDRALAIVQGIIRLRLDHKGNPDTSLQGRVSFLEAHPIKDGYPKVDLELDVLTCHHDAYYGGKRDVARDTENPTPVHFPVVAPGITFLFTIDGRDPRLVGLARQALAVGLNVFGIGAKTAAGYGWFDTAEELNKQFLSALPMPSKVPSSAMPRPTKIGDYDEEAYLRFIFGPIVLRPNERGAFMQVHLPKLKLPENRPWLIRLIEEAEASKEKSMKKTRIKPWYVELKQIAQC